MNQYFGVAKIGEKKKIVLDYDIVTRLFSVMRESPNVRELVETGNNMGEILLKRLDLAENELESIFNAFSKAIKTKTNPEEELEVPIPKIEAHKQKKDDQKIDNLKVGDADADLDSLDLDLEED